MDPKAYIIAGPNGAGKTTFAREFLPSYADCRNFINADLIAQGISPLAPETAAFRSGRLVLAEIKLFMNRRADFGFETTLAGRSYLNLIRRLKNRGYQLNFFFLWIPDVELALARIRQRVLKGGHDVPENDARRRFDRSIRNFLINYRNLADSWILFNSSETPPSIIAFQKKSSLHIIEASAYNAVVARYGKQL